MEYKKLKELNYFCNKLILLYSNKGNGQAII